MSFCIRDGLLLRRPGAALSDAAHTWLLKPAQRRVIHHTTASCQADEPAAHHAAGPSRQSGAQAEAQEGFRLQMPRKPTFARRTRVKSRSRENVTSLSIPSSRKNVRSPRDASDDQAIKVASTSLEQAIIDKDGAKAYDAWRSLLSVGAGAIGVPSLEQTLGVVEVVDNEEGFRLDIHQELAKRVVHQHGARKSFARCMRPFFLARHHKEALDIVQGVLSDPAFVQRPADGRLWQLSSQLIAVAAMAVIAMGTPLHLIDLVRKLAAFPVSGRGADSFDGCPVSLSIARNSLQLLTEEEKLHAEAAIVIEQAMLAWGLDFKSDSPERTISIAGRLASTAGRRDWEAIEAYLNRGRIAQKLWLRVAADHKEEADWNDTAWSVLLAEAMGDKQYNVAGMAWDFYSDVKGTEKAPTSRVWNGLLTGYARAKDFDSVMRTWEQMQNQPGARDWYTITTMISALFRASRLDQAVLMFEEARADAANRNVDMPVEVYNAVLLGLCYNRRREDAFSLFDRMMKQQEKNIARPNIVTFNTLLRACGRMGDFDNISVLLRELSRSNLKADKVTFTTILDAMSRSGQHNLVGRVLRTMMAENVLPNAVTLTALIKSFLGGADGSDDHADVALKLVGEQAFESDRQQVTGKERFDLAFELLEFMEANGPTPTEVTYSALMASVFQSPKRMRDFLEKDLIPISFLQPRNDDPSEVCMSLLRRMQKRGLAPNRKTYHILLAGLLQLSSPSTFRNIDNAFTIWTMMQRDPHAPPQARTWLLVLQELINRCQEYERASLPQFVGLAARLEKFLATREDGAEQDDTPRWLLRLLDEGNALVQRAKLKGSSQTHTSPV